MNSRWVVWMSTSLMFGATLIWMVLISAMPRESAGSGPSKNAVFSVDSHRPAVSGSGSDAPQSPESQKPAEATSSATTSAPQPPGEPVEKRIVPVVSLGDGVRIGAVQITGPKSYAHQVKAVVLLEGDYKDVVRFRVLIPIKTERVIQQMERVPFVAVTGIVDLKVS
ncbi:MAG: hypothetical protein V2G42_06085 [bacterium JZ-2024 1]